MNDERLEVVYGANEIEKYKRDILTAGLCSLFLPAAFIEEGAGVGAVYDTKGYYSLLSAKKRGLSVLLGVVISILENSRQAERRYIFSGEYSLDPEVIYVKRGIPEAGLIFRKASPMDKIMILEKLRNIIDLCNDESATEKKNEALSILTNDESPYDVIIYKLRKLENDVFMNKK